MRPEYRPQVSEQYKKKIENIVRKPIGDSNETVEGTSPCMYCSFSIADSQLDCPNCKNISPFCIVTGMRMLKDDWAYCPSCYFPCRRSAVLALAQAEEACPMCDTPFKAPLPAVTD